MNEIDTMDTGIELRTLDESDTTRLYTGAEGLIECLFCAGLVADFPFLFFLVSSSLV